MGGYYFCDASGHNVQRLAHRHHRRRFKLQLERALAPRPRRSPRGPAAISTGASEMLDNIQMADNSRACAGIVAAGDQTP